MAERMHRTQILLEPAQHEWLVGTARVEERSVSDLIRKMIDRQINDANTKLRLTKVRRLAALDRISQRREKLLEEMGGQPISGDTVEMINRIREERSDEIFGTLTGRR
jgi:formamidopyrimidine-DNA glycosylase